MVIVKTAYWRSFLFFIFFPDRAPAAAYIGSYFSILCTIEDFEIIQVLKAVYNGSAPKGSRLNKRGEGEIRTTCVIS